MLTTKCFGRVVRELRMARRITLREFARRLGVSAAYVSLVERGEASIPVEERIEAMAQILGTDPDMLLAQAGRLAADLSPIIRQHPREMATFLRTASGLSAPQLRQLARHAEQLKALTTENHHASDCRTPEGPVPDATPDRARSATPVG